MEDTNKTVKFTYCGCCVEVTGSTAIIYVMDDVDINSNEPFDKMCGNCKASANKLYDINVTTPYEPTYNIHQNLCQKCANPFIIQYLRLKLTQGYWDNMRS